MLKVLAGLGWTRRSASLQLPKQAVIFDCWRATLRRGRNSLNTQLCNIFSTYSLDTLSQWLEITFGQELRYEGK